MLKGCSRGNRNTPFLPHRKFSCTFLTILPGQLMQLYHYIWCPHSYLFAMRATYQTCLPVSTYTAVWLWCTLVELSSSLLPPEGTVCPAHCPVACPVASRCREGMGGRTAQHVAVKCGVTILLFVNSPWMWQCAQWVPNTNFGLLIQRSKARL